MGARHSPEAPSRERFLRAASGKRTDRPPVWMMRQAGRYLPEYRERRESVSFKEAISTPSIAVEISLQPWERFRPDGVVMYSDIMPALELLGLEYRLESGVGPVVEQDLATPADLHQLERSGPGETLPHVGESLDRLSTHLAEQAAVIGFVGGPFTLAAYALEGEPSRSFVAARSFRYRHPDAFTELLDRLAAVVAEYAQYQVTAGADVVQLFDTYAGLVDPITFREELLPRYRSILSSVEAPTILFVRNPGDRLESLADTGADVVGLDWTVEMETARDRLGTHPVQGNLDPAALFADRSDIRQRTRTIIDAAGPAGHIMNLGHGVHKSTPVDGVATFFDTVQTATR